MADAPRNQGRPQAPPSTQTQTQRAWKGLNLTDSRLTLDDDELYRCENAMPLGRGIAPTPLYNGPAGNPIHTGSLIKESLGTSLTYAPYTVPHPVTIAVFEDGSAWMRDHYLDGAIDSQIAPAGTFSSSPGGTGIVPWQDGPILFLDAQAGYCKWTGTTFTVIDATKKGHQLAVFSGYVFLLLGPRTITVTAPNTFDDFAAGDGAVTFKITDEAFQGSVQALVSTVQQLWVVGVSSIDALGNISTTSGVTTFSITNAVTTIGSAFGDSVLGYYRSLVFATGYSIHSLLGVTPQKLSGKVDRYFSFLMPATTFGPRPGVVEVNGVIVLAYLYTFTDPLTGAASTKLLCFDEGKFFIAGTPDLAGNRVLDMVTLTISSVPEVYGIDALGCIYRIFARPGDPMKGTVTVSSKLSDRGNPLEEQQAVHIGFDLSAPLSTGMTKLTLTVASERLAVSVDTNFLQGFLPAADAWLGLRYALYRKNATISGQRLGWSLSYPCADLVTLEAAHLEVGDAGAWNPSLGSPATYVWTDGGPFVWTDGGQPYVWVDA